MSDYDQFARFYDAIMGVPEDRIRMVRQLIRQYNPPALSVLELGCGTGSVLKGLVDRYAVSGLDRSEKMLEVAESKVAEGRFYQGDMANFQLDEQFDVIICVFDSINHLLKFEQWQSLFKCAYEHLNPGGLFVFDMNTVSRLRAVAQTPFEERFEGGKWLVEIKETQGVFEWKLGFVEDLGDGRMKKYEETIRETAFDPKSVELGLKKLFKIRTVEDVRGGAVKPDSARIWFVGQKSDSWLSPDTN